MKYIIVYGNPIDGLMFMGSFDDVEEASQCANNFISSEWWIAEIQNPFIEDEEEVPDE